ncbi:MAG TPA: hypothetical protein VEC12_03965 [Bacteroidia bacterium]|nr:hypothetical protein [Bacteroidia bacterium]
MTEWWSALSTEDKVVWSFTIIATLIFVIQTISTFMGMDNDAGLSADFSGNLNSDVDLGGAHDVDASDAAPFQLFTFRNFINFFLGFGWSVISLQNSIHNRVLLNGISFLIGAGLVALVMYMFFRMSKLSHDGTMNIKNAINQTGQVYLNIPAEKSGTGKMHINIQGSLHELDAMTDGDKIPSGAMARVKEIVNGKILLVEKI